MILKINGNVKPYYIQTLSMIFFPGVKFPDDEEETYDTLKAVINIDETDDNVSSDVTISQGEKSCTAHECVNRGLHDDEKTIKIAAGSAFLKSGVMFTGFNPPWGILTGVRPAKVATELMDNNRSAEEAMREIERDYLVSPNKAKLAVDVSAAERRLITDEVRKECSVYIGIPFCPTRCAYCSFVSYTSPKLLKLIPEYLTALSRDIDGTFDIIRELGMKVRSVYIGGGTPTILNAEQLDFLLACVNKNVCGIEEFTLEAGRPDTITAEKLKVAYNHGVDRMSVNTQTMNDEVLKKIGRAHDSNMFLHAYEIAKNSGIKNINVDLIAGLPYDTTESFMNSIDRVIELDPENITVHTFSVKKSSEFKIEGKFDPSSVIAAESVNYSQSVLAANNYLPYYMYRQKNTVGNLENVGYSKIGHEGLYNVYMMEEVHSIFSSGASSVTKLVSVPDANGDVRIERFFRPKYPYEYLKDCAEEDYKLGQLRDAAKAFFNK